MEQLNKENPYLLAEISKYFNDYTGKYLINISSIYTEDSRITTIKLLNIPIYRKVAYYNSI